MNGMDICTYSNNYVLLQTQLQHLQLICPGGNIHRLCGNLNLVVCIPIAKLSLAHRSLDSQVCFSNSRGGSHFIVRQVLFGRGFVSE